MLNKLYLCHQIRKFYKIFGDALEWSPCRISVRDFANPDFINAVRFDVHEAIDSQANLFDEAVYPIDIWLNKLYHALEV